MRGVCVSLWRVRGSASLAGPAPHHDNPHNRRIGTVVVFYRLITPATLVSLGIPLLRLDVGMAGHHV